MSQPRDARPNLTFWSIYPWTEAAHWRALGVPESDIIALSYQDNRPYVVPWIPRKELREFIGYDGPCGLPSGVTMVADTYLHKRTSATLVDLSMAVTVGPVTREQIENAYLGWTPWEREMEEPHHD